MVFSIEGNPASGMLGLGISSFSRKQQSGIQPFQKSTEEESEVRKGTMRNHPDRIST